MHRLSLLTLVGLLTACSLPPRETDRSTPEGTFRTFRGAIARGETEREWDCFSPRLQGQLGMSSRLDWKTARAVVLTQDHRVVKGLSLAKLDGEPETLADGRVRLPFRVAVPFVSITGTVTMRQINIVRAWRPGESEPVLNWSLRDLRLSVGVDGMGVVFPPDLLAELINDEDSDLERDMPLERFEAARIWFLDGFTVDGSDENEVQEEVARETASEENEP